MIDNGNQPKASIEFKDYELLAHKITRRLHGHVQKFGLNMQYEDVFQDVSLGYCEALASYNPQKGFAFSTYFFRTARNNFYKAHQKAFKQHELCRTISLDDKADEDSNSYHEVVASQQFESAEVTLERESDFEKRIKRFSPLAQVIVRQIRNPSPSVVEAFRARTMFMEHSKNVGEKAKSYRSLSINVVCSALGLDRQQALTIKREIQKKCKVQL